MKCALLTAATAGPSEVPSAVCLSFQKGAACSYRRRGRHGLPCGAGGEVCGCKEGSQGHGCCNAVSGHDGRINGYGSGDHVCCTYKQWSSLCASLHSSAVPAAALVSAAATAAAAAR